MWICANNAFLSIVQPSLLDIPAGAPDDVLMVRARRKGDIEAIFPGEKVLRTPGRDYLFRAFIPRRVVAEVIADQVESIGYGNFKDSVRDNGLHNAYHRVWGVMSSLQPVPPYASRGRRQGSLL